MTEAESTAPFACHIELLERPIFIPSAVERSIVIPSEVTGGNVVEGSLDYAPYDKGGEGLLVAQ